MQLQLVYIQVIMLLHGRRQGISRVRTSKVHCQNSEDRLFSRYFIFLLKSGFTEEPMSRVISLHHEEKSIELFRYETKSNYNCYQCS